MSKVRTARRMIAAFILIAISTSIPAKDSKELPFRGQEDRVRLAGSVLSNTSVSYVPSQNKLVMSGVQSTRPGRPINGFAIVNASDGKVVGVVPHEVKQMRFAPDGASFVTLSDTIQLWHTSNVKPSKVLKALDDLKSPVAAAFTSEGKMLAVVGHIDDFGKPLLMKAVDLPSGKERWMVRLEDRTWRNDGSRRLVSSESGSLLFTQDQAWRLFDFKSGELQSTFGGGLSIGYHLGGSIYLYPNAKRFVRVPQLGDHDGLDVWDIEKRDILNRGNGINIFHGVGRITVSKFLAGDDRRSDVLIFGQRDGSLKMLDLNTLKVIDFGDKHKDAITAIDASATKRIVVTGSVDFRIKVWDLETTQLLDTFLEDKAEVVTVAISPDGERIVSCCANAPVRIWNLK